MNTARLRVYWFKGGVYDWHSKSPIPLNPPPLRKGKAAICAEKYAEQGDIQNPHETRFH